MNQVSRFREEKENSKARGRDDDGGTEEGAYEVLLLYSGKSTTNYARVAETVSSNLLFTFFSHAKLCMRLSSHSTLCLNKGIRGL